MVLSIRPLAAHHRREAFDCGVASLNDWLRNTAAQHRRKNISVTHVLTDDAAPNDAIAYYALTSCMVRSANLPAPRRKKLPLGVPGIKLGRLAVNLHCAGQGHGETMLLDAVERSRQVSAQIGVYALFVDALDNGAARFYQSYGFAAFPDLPLTLFLQLSPAQI